MQKEKKKKKTKMSQKFMYFENIQSLYKKKKKSVMTLKKHIKKNLILNLFIFFTFFSQIF